MELKTEIGCRLKLFFFLNVFGMFKIFVVNHWLTFFHNYEVLRLPKPFLCCDIIAWIIYPIPRALLEKNGPYQRVWLLHDLCDFLLIVGNYIDFSQNWYLKKIFINKYINILYHIYTENMYISESKISCVSKGQ